jgi:5-methyltetrahydropteroyltriglutamate--homocysteine methyltransferase
VADTFKYRTDHVGSLLKPEALKRAQADHAADFKAKQDQEIAAAVAWQRDMSLAVVTDGEFARSSDTSILEAALDGLERQGGEVYVSGTLKARSRLAAREAQYLTSLTRTPIKVCLPAPGMLAENLFKPGVTEAAYRSVAELGLTLAGIIRGEIAALIADGVRYVQLDNGAYGNALPDPARFGRMLAADTEAVKGITRADGVCVALFVGRGGAERSALFDPRNTATAQRLLATLPVDRFVLDIDEAVSDFSVLRALPKERSVALGLISTGSRALETADSVMARIDKAAEHFDADNLALSPQTGFAGLDAVFSVADQKRKLELTASAATRYWGFGM